MRTATAAGADAGPPITPGTDAALLLAVVHTLLAENLIKLGGVEPHIDGVDRMRQVAAESPERAPRPPVSLQTVFAPWPASWRAPNAPSCTAE